MLPRKGNANILEGTFSSGKSIRKAPGDTARHELARSGLYTAQNLKITYETAYLTISAPSHYCDVAFIQCHLAISCYVNA
jgi:hypothetical protein